MVHADLGASIPLAHAACNKAWGFASINLRMSVSFSCRPVYRRFSTPPSHSAVVSMAEDILMNRTRSQLLRFLIAHGPASCGDASLALGLSQSAVRRQIRLLCGAGMVRSAAGTFTAQLDQIERHLQELSAGFHHPATDRRNPGHEGAHLLESTICSCECPGTSEDTS